MLLTSYELGVIHVIYSQASQTKNTWCKGHFVYIENCMGKSPIVKKVCNNYLI